MDANTSEVKWPCDLNEQAIFDYVAEKLLMQGTQARTNRGCAYRGEGGRRCAVGWLIPDEIYDSSMEGAGIRKLFEQAEWCDKLELLLRFERLLVSLQGVHDTVAPQYWLEELRKVAHIYLLNTSVLYRVQNELRGEG